MSGTASGKPREKGDKATLSLPELQHLLGRAIADKGLRQRLLEKPGETLRELGYPNHPDAVKFFKTLGEKGFKDAAETFDSFTKNRGDPAFNHGET